MESLTAARKRALSGNEPSDAIRVVNAVLTQLDRLKSHKNVLVLATSNVTGAIGTCVVLLLIEEILHSLIELISSNTLEIHQ